MKQPYERFVALDVFRGITICFMIIVNTAGYGAPAYAPLNHAEWFGFTPTDLVFPSFLFAVGNALSFSIKKYETDRHFLSKLFKRAFIIFLLGYLMYWFPFFQQDATGHWFFKSIATTRIFGVLQRIALCYFFGALIVKYFSVRTSVVISVALLFGYWVLLYAFGTPGQELDIFGNAGSHLDQWLIGPAHMYINEGPGKATDPEGLLSTLPAIVNVIAGYVAGIFIQRKGKNFETIAKLFIIGSLLVFVALFWSQFFPFAKKIWTSSFTVLTIGIDAMILGLIIYLIELKQWKYGTNFFLVMGKNPLVVYLVSELLITVLRMIMVTNNNDFYQWINIVFFQKIFPGSFGALIFSLCYMLVCWCVGWFLNKRRIYIKV